MKGLYRQLVAQKAELTTKQKSIHAQVDASAEGWTDELRAQDDEIAASLEQVNADITREERRRAADMAAAAVDHANDDTDEEAADKAGAVAASPTPFHSLGEQLQAVARAALQPHAPVDERLLQIQAATGASEIVGSDGGFLVQTDISNDLLTEVFADAVLAPLAQERQVGAGFNGTKFNVIDETSRATGSRFGGVRAYWTAEGGQKNASRPKFRQEELTLQKLAGLYVATDELLADTVALESFVRPAFVSEFAFMVDDAMVRGTGAGMPLGILNSPALVTVAKETGQSADSVLYENLIAMFGRLSPRSVSKAQWFVNQGLYAQFPSMVMTIGTGGVPVFLPPGGLTQAPFGTMLGRPITVIEQASAPGDVGDIMLADWNEYLLLRKGTIEQASSIHVYFDTDETAFRWVLRINGRPMRQSALTPYKGSATTSPFITLAAR